MDHPAVWQKTNAVSAIRQSRIVDVPKIGVGETRGGMIVFVSIYARDDIAVRGNRPELTVCAGPHGVPQRQSTLSAWL